MASRLITVLIVCFIISPLLPGSAAAEPANQGIWLQATNSGDQAWAYYPYDTAHPYTGGKYSPVNNGTVYFNVSPGRTIARKFIIHNHETYNDSVNFSVVGLPAGWIAKCSPVRIASVQNYVQFPNHVSKYVPMNMTHVGYGGVVITIPENASPGSYSYSITAVSGTGYTSSLADMIVVGSAGSPIPGPTATIKGQVTVNGVATNGVTVTCGSAAAVQTVNNTSADGIFTIGGLPLGQMLTYNASYNGYNSTGTVDPISDSTRPIWAGIVNIEIPITPSPVPVRINMLADPGFENGIINKSVWAGSKSSNYKNDQIIVTRVAAHNGTFGIVGAKNDYCRAAQNVPYGGHGFEFSAWFYVNLSDPARTSVWAGVLNVNNSNTANLDNLTYSRAIGYNNRTPGTYHHFQYEIGANIYRNLSRVNQSGWHNGRISYDGKNMTYAEYDSMGNMINTVTYPDPGFVPAAVIVNAGSKSQYIDDLYYTTW